MYLTLPTFLTYLSTHLCSLPIPLTRSIYLTLPSLTYLTSYLPTYLPTYLHMFLTYLLYLPTYQCSFLLKNYPPTYLPTYLLYAWLCGSLLPPSICINSFAQSHVPDTRPPSLPRWLLPPCWSAAPAQFFCFLLSSGVPAENSHG